MRDERVAERMRRWRATAQCQCAGHAMEAMRCASDEWDFLDKLDKWKKTPEGQRFQSDVAALARDLSRKA